MNQPTNKDVYEITSYVQAKVFSNKLRIKIFSLFDDQVPKTSKQIADQMGLPASKVHYHVRELAKVGLLVLTETREKGGVIEKYYLPVAKQIHIRLKEDEAPQEGEKSGEYLITKSYFRDYQEGFLQEVERKDEQKKSKKTERGHGTFMSGSLLSLTEEKHKQMVEEMRQLMEKWAQLEDPEGPDTRISRMLLSAYIQSP
ncbi:ArsR/SmtB family transcription factor [Paenibacillus guangzhouensis]|uniref:ArsR/SmtB family transcription factor n=1 Tax=Paenibacillus guangzhouensis TaxID=1473112 RepID=UPI0012672912|nr:helix-turn-helix domain-containing protein [Paenibacillus guangzhouensis]